MDIWTDYPIAPFNIVWHHPAGWRATICLTQVGQFSAWLGHLDNGSNLSYDDILIDQVHGHEFEKLTQQALARFDSWIAEQGQEALDELPVALVLQRKHVRPLLERIPGWEAQAAAEGWQTLPLRAALMRLKSEFENSFKNDLFK